MDLSKQIDYWTTGSQEDFAAAQSLLEKGHYRHSLFFVHLSLEKMLKALVVIKTNNVPPKIHNLTRLSEIAEISVELKIANFLRSFDMYQLAGRYPDHGKIALDLKIATEKLTMAGEIIQWLKAKL
jgi:HEPN domain-containing protein